MKFLILQVFLLALLGSASVHAAGFLRLESDGFLRYSDQRPNATQTLSVGPRTQSENAYLATELDLQANVQMADSSTFTPEARNLYVATSPRLSPQHQMTLGRRTESWSEMDDQWEAGIYSPRFLWDFTRPQKVGLTGLMYQHRSKHLQISAFGTGMDIPERGFPIREESGKITSSNPFYVPLYEFAELQGTRIAIRYRINYPPIRELVMNPGGLLKVRYQQDEGRGAWLQVSGGYMPIHQAGLSIEDSQFYDPRTNIANIQVHPTIDYHQLLTLESGWKSKRLSFWGSITREDPEDRGALPGRISPQLERSLIGAVGTQLQVSRTVRLSGSFLHIHEEDSPAPSKKSSIDVDLPGRFTYKRAVRSNLSIMGNGRMSYGARWIYDLVDESHLASADTFINVFKGSKDLTLNLGADFFISSAGKGVLGQYKGDDRVRGGLSYVF